MAVQSLKLYFFAFIFVVFLQKVYFTPLYLFLFFCSIWLPQIWKNTMEGSRNSPSVRFALVITLHTVYVPMYFMLVEDNMLFLKPHPLFFWGCVLWMLIQLVVLKIQHTKPRFLIPSSIRPYLFSGFYRYETTFSDEAAISDN